MRIKHLTIVIIMTIIKAMKRRSLYFVMCALSLGAGGALYLLCREHSYITVLAEHVLPLENLREYLHVKDIDFLNYYFPDFLWSFAFYFGAELIFYPQKRVFTSSVLVLCAGALWELLQYTGIVGGTGDLLDILMYLTAVLTAVLIEKFLKYKEN